MKLKITSSLLLVSFLTACGAKTPQLAAGLTGGGSDGQQGQSTQGTTTPIVVSPNIDSVDMKSRVDDSSNKMGFNGSLAFDIDKNRGEFVIMLPMPQGVVFTPSGSFTKYPDITFTPMFDGTGKMKMAVRVPVKYLLKGITTVPATSLPNGDPLPAMPAGKSELPSLALSFPSQNNTKISLYIGLSAVGLFMTLPDKAAFPLPINITLPLKNSDKTRTFGYLTYVNAKNGHQPGLFISAVVPPEFARILEDHFGLQ
jgi:hypothetical protein